MLDKDVSIVNLNPYTWRNLGRILGLGKYNKNLYVLYDNNGVVINTYSDGVNIILNETLIQNVECYAKKTLKEHNDIQRIYLLNKNALIEFNKHMQETPYENMDVDEYIEYAIDVFNNMDGIYVYPKLDILPVIKLLKKYISGLGNNIYIAICIFKNDDLYFSLIIGKKDGKINFISTLDHLEHMGIKNITPKDKEKVLNALKDAFNENVVLKFMKFDELEELVKNIV